MFSHIYIESEAYAYKETRHILSQFPNAKTIQIGHYKDVFCRRNQQYVQQKQAPSLILAVKKQNLIYKGAPVCQDFGNKHFYYTSNIMNCVFDCEYCYLQGMYPSGHIVIFVNIQDIFDEVEKLLKKHPVYLCISYDTDLLAMESITGYGKTWIDFATKHPDLTIEIRTKCSNYHLLTQIKPIPNVILAWTISPEPIIAAWEHKTASMEKRLSAAKKAAEDGWRIRLCFDPILYCHDWKSLYRDMVTKTFCDLKTDQVFDVSIGVFRVSKDYLKRMRKLRPASSVLQYPFAIEAGVYDYGKDLSLEMIHYVKSIVEEYVPEDKIFIWENN